MKRSTGISGPFTILHIPHSSRSIPQELRRSFLLSNPDLEAELIRMTDSYTDELFNCDPQLACKVVFPVSRLVVDPERFVDDTTEPMAARGMGVIYTKTSDGLDLRRPVSAQERKTLLAQYYQPHHEKLSRAVEMALAANSKCLIIDCHSFPSIPLPYEPNQSPDRPDICVGTDEYHTPGWLKDLALDVFSRYAFRVEVDRPYSGALVPLTYYRQDPAVLSLMIEVKRSLYMDEVSGEGNEGFSMFRSDLKGLLETLVLRAQMTADP